MVSIEHIRSANCQGWSNLSTFIETKLIFSSSLSLSLSNRKQLPQNRNQFYWFNCSLCGLRSGDELVRPAEKKNKNFIPIQTINFETIHFISMVFVHPIMVCPGYKCVGFVIRDSIKQFSLSFFILVTDSGMYKLTPRSLSMNCNEQWIRNQVNLSL